MLNLKGITIAVLIAGALGALGGWQVRDAFCDAAAAKLEIANLKKQLAARDAAATQDQINAGKDAEERAALEGAIRDLESKISAGVCLGADDADRLRSLWK
jgi:hypothetical protein